MKSPVDELLRELLTPAPPRLAPVLLLQLIIPGHGGISVSLLQFEVAAITWLRNGSARKLGDGVLLLPNLTDAERFSLCKGTGFLDLDSKVPAVVDFARQGLGHA